MRRALAVLTLAATACPAGLPPARRNAPELPPKSFSFADRPSPRPARSRKAPRPSRALSGPLGRSSIDALLWRIALCESGGRFDARSPSGRYAGAWQWDRGTWAAYGPAGDPAKASPAEQWRRARLLYAARSISPWPVCGPKALRDRSGPAGEAGPGNPEAVAL